MRIAAGIQERRQLYALFIRVRCVTLPLTHSTEEAFYSIVEVEVVGWYQDCRQICRAKFLSWVRPLLTLSLSNDDRRR